MARKKKEMDNLAKDAAAALAAGMSYGKWKALQENPVVEEKNEDSPKGWKVCPRCGKSFKPNKWGSGRQIYCDVGCQMEANAERNRERNLERQRLYRERKRAEGSN